MIVTFLSQINRKLKENTQTFVNDPEPTYSSWSTNTQRSLARMLGDLVWFIAFWVGLYLLFKCHKGSDMNAVGYFGHFIFLCCCSPCYVAYLLATSMDKCFPKQA